MPSSSLLAKIHIAKKDLGWTEDVYRGVLLQKFKVDSSKDLSDQQAIAMLDLCKQHGWKQKKALAERKARRDGRYIEIPPGPAAAQQRKVLAMWNELGYAIDKLHTRVKKQFGVDRFEWLTDNRQLHVLITDLQARLNQ